MTSQPERTVTPTTSLEVRERIVEALRLDLIGPWAGHPLQNERLGWERPSAWYVTGFLVPAESIPEQGSDVDVDEDIEQVQDSLGLTEESTEEPKSAKKNFFPSSMGLSFLVDPLAEALAVIVRWGDYRLEEVEGSDGNPARVWVRKPRAEALRLPLSRPVPCTEPVPRSGGLHLQVVRRRIA